MDIPIPYTYRLTAEAVELISEQGLPVCLIFAPAGTGNFASEVADLLLYYVARALDAEDQEELRATLSEEAIPVFPPEVQGPSVRRCVPPAIADLYGL